ncbi:hypothetical protein YC2023_054692 [Brassica napus]
MASRDLKDFGQESFVVDKILKYISFSPFKKHIFLRNKLHDSSTISLKEFLAKWDEGETDIDEFSSYDDMLAAQDFTQRYKLRRPENMYFQAHRFRKPIRCTISGTYNEKLTGSIRVAQKELMVTLFQGQQCL